MDCASNLFTKLLTVKEPSADNPYHAWFSAEAAVFAGSGIWLHEDGREVEVTLAHHDRTEGEQAYGWDDAVYLGKVTKRLRDGQHRFIVPPVNIALDYPYYP